MNQHPAVPGPERRRLLGVALSTVSLALILWSTLRSHPGVFVSSSEVHWSVLDFLLNVLLFLPLGAGLSLLGLGAGSAVAIGALLSGGIELAQLWWVVGRFSSILDVAANIVGAITGIAIVRRWEQRSRWWPTVAKGVAAIVVIIWLLGSACVGPAIPGPVAWVVDRPDGRIDGDSRGPQVLSASLQGVPLVAGPIADVPGLRALLASSDTMRFEAILLTGPTTGDSLRLLEIVVGEGFDPYLVLSQEGDRLAVYYRLRMTWLGARGPSLVLVHGTSAVPGDTVRISLYATLDELRLQAVRGSATSESRIRLSPDLFLSALFNRATDSTLWWRILPALLSFVALGLALAKRPTMLVLALGLALFLGPWASGAAVPGWPVLLVALVGAVGGRRLATDLALFPDFIHGADSRSGTPDIR